MTASSLPRRLRRTAVLPVFAAASLVLAACGSSDDGDDASADGGFSLNIDDCEDPDAAQATIKDTFTVGYSAPLSGPVAGVVELASAGFKARIDAANAAGGIDGVKIEVDYKDDAFSPDKAKANGTEFLQKDKVDGLNTFGAGQVAAIADDQNAACVPFLYPSSSDAQFNDMEAYPWTVQFLPSAEVETKFLVQYIQDNVDDPKVFVVENATASGKAMGEAFQESAKDAGLEVVGTAEDTDPNAAATSAKASEANVVYHAGVVGSCGVFDTAMSRIGFDPELVVKASNCVNAPEYIAAGDAADGVVVAKYIKDPADPDLASDANVKKYLEDVKGAADPNNAVTISGWTQADLLVNTLTQAAKSDDGLTRESVIKAARDQDYASPMLLDGISWLSSSERPAGVSGFEPFKWDAKQQRFVSAGDVISVD